MKLVQFIERHYRKIAIIVYVVFYFMYIITRFTPSCLHHPIIQIDYSWHFVDMVNSARFFEEDNRIWGYNPYHSAGTNVGIVLAISNHWALLFNILLGKFFTHAIVFNLSVLIALLLLPILAFFTAKNFEFERMNSLLFFALTILFLRGFLMLKAIISYGLYGFVLGTFLSIYTTSLFFKYLNDKSRKNLILLTLFASLTFFVHPLSLIICSALCAPLCIFYFKRFTISDFWKLLLSASFVLLTNLIWIVPNVRFSEYLEGTWHFFQTDAGLFISQMTNPFFIVILVLFLFSVINSIRENAFSKSIALSYLLLFILSFFGSQLGFSDWEPGRFIIPSVLVSLLLIAKTFEFKKINRGVLLLFLVVVITAATSQVFKLSCEYPAEAHKLLEFIKTNTTENSRLHVEDGNTQYFKSHFTSYIPYATSRQVLAAEYFYPTDKFMFPQFINNEVFGENISTISDTEFAKYLELYNVKYFLIFNESAYKFFDSHERFRKIFSVNDSTDKKDPDTFSLYEYMDANESFCYNCSADVFADYDIIKVFNATSNTTILKYHYYDTLKIKPELTMKPIMMLEDLIPFIMVENGNQTNFTIYTD